MQQMSCYWRLLGTKKRRNQFQNLEGQNLEGKSQHFVLSVACSQTIFVSEPPATVTEKLPSKPPPRHANHFDTFWGEAFCVKMLLSPDVPQTLFPVLWYPLAGSRGRHWRPGDYLSSSKGRNNPFSEQDCIR